MRVRPRFCALSRLLAATSTGALTAAMSACSAPQPEPAPEAPLGGHELGRAVAIELSGNPDAQAYRIVEDGIGNLVLTQPIRDRVAPALMGQLAAAFGQPVLRFVRALAPDAAPQQLAELGLASPQAFLHARFADDELRIDFGGVVRNEPLSLWIQRDGNLFHGPGTLIAALRFNQEDIRDPRLFAWGAPHELRGVTIDRGRDPGIAPLVQIDRGKDGWSGIAPAGVDAGQVARELTALVRGPPRYGGEREWPAPDLVVTVRSTPGAATETGPATGPAAAGDRAQELSLYRQEDGTWLGRQPLRDLPFPVRWPLLDSLR